MVRLLRGIAMPVATPEYVADYLNIDGNEARPLLTRLCEAVNVQIADYCGRVFEKHRHTEYHDIPYAGTGEVFVRNPPLSVLYSVTDDANTPVITSGRGNRSITTAANVELLPAQAPLFIRLVNNESAFTVGSQTVKIVYAGGYEEDAIPADLQLAGAMMVAVLWEGAEPLARASQNIDGEQIVWRGEALPLPAQIILDKYRRVLIA